MFRFDQPTSGSACPTYGMVVYSKQRLHESALNHCVHKVGGGVIEMVSCSLKTDFPDSEVIHLAACYASPKCTWLQKRQFLEANKQCYEPRPDTATVLCGDFNIDLLAQPNHPILRTVSFPQLIHESTTDNNSLLDHMYISESHLRREAGVLESYFSDHKAIFAILRM